MLIILRVIKRELSDIRRQTPGDLARVFARLSVACDSRVIFEDEFQKVNKNFNLLERKKAKLESRVKELENRLAECQGIALELLAMGLNGDVDGLRVVQSEMLKRKTP